MQNELAKITLGTIASHNMLAPGEFVLVAVSGGPDSMALMHVLHGLSEELGIRLAVAHFDHGLRPESGRDAEFVNAAARDLGLDFVTERAELSGLPGNVQTLARDARYDFLERAAAGMGCTRVATGHNMNDQAETYLMREIRGSGTAGQKGIPPVRGVYIRPLIQARREEILAYLEARDVNYLTDPSNLKPVYLRNRVRIELLPLIENINPNAVEIMAHASDTARAEDDFLAIRSASALEECTLNISGTSVSLDAERMRSMHPAIRRRVIRGAIERIKGDLLGITYTHTLDAERIITGGDTGKGVDLPGGIRVESEYGTAVFSIPVEPVPYRYALCVPGLTEIPEAGVTIGSEYVNASPQRPEEAVIDPSRLKGRLEARSRLPGDRFRPSGLEGSIKLKDYFINEKVPRRKRDTVPLVVSGDEIVWVAGHRADGRFLADETTKNPLRLFFSA